MLVNEKVILFFIQLYIFQRFPGRIPMFEEDAVARGREEVPMGTLLLV